MKFARTNSAMFRFSLAGIGAVFRREMASLFATPSSFIFAGLFAVAVAALTFYVGDLLGRGVADLKPMFTLIPWVFLFFAPAMSMRQWSEERRLGTAELLLTLPISTPAAVLGKFLASWAFGALALVLTVPLWLTVNYLGNPDNGVIVANYIAAMLLLGTYLAVGAFVSALTRSQTLAFILTVLICFLLLAAGAPFLVEALHGVVPGWMLAIFSALSMETHAEAIARGVLDMRDILYFVLMMAAFLLATRIVVDAGREKL